MASNPDHPRTGRPVIRARQAIAWALGLFVFQVLVNGYDSFSGLTGKSQALASMALAHVMTSPATMLWLVYYLLLVIVSYCAPLLLMTKIFNDLGRHGPQWCRQLATQRGVGSLGLAAGVLLMVLLNRQLFPSQATGELPNLAPASWAMLIVLAGTAVATIILWLGTAASFAWRSMVLACAAIVSMGSMTPIKPSDPTERPNIIVLGVDSMRPDHLRMFGDKQAQTPNIDQFLAGAKVFDHAYTTQARTFVAYMSVLSGRYPTSNAVRENLFPRALFKREHMFPQQLRNEGYHTVFFMDESRFANIDQSFGFDEVASPPEGIIDFMVAPMYSTAPAHLLQLVPGAWRLIPHVAGNRAMAEAYDAKLASARVRRAINRAPSDKPLLMLAHFCLAHTPFAFGQWTGHLPQGAYADSPLSYRKALTMADGQVGQALDDLRRSGRLDNAIVVLMSDHGEGLGMDKDQLRQGETANEAPGFPQDYGHGGSALAADQVHVVMAISRYRNGEPVWRGERIKAPASLVDIAPTLLSLAGISHDEKQPAFDGLALLDNNGMAQAPGQRPLFVESGISGPSLMQERIDPVAVANEFAGLYTISTDLRFELRQDELALYMAGKQRGIIDGHLGVASLPSRNTNPARNGCWMVVDYFAGTISCLVGDRANQKIGRQISLICDHYAADKMFHQQWCQGPARPNGEPALFPRQPTSVDADPLSGRE